MRRVRSCRTSAKPRCPWRNLAEALDLSNLASWPAASALVLFAAGKEAGDQADLGMLEQHGWGDLGRIDLSGRPFDYCDLTTAWKRYFCCEADLRPAGT
ncbi:hypothetical protein MPL3356_140004 [Mesorhizobium plurifarium]|uniref:Uncharacterized protein n=1 Tax=Mesorhizobium plurifarium TaxID=69974 RepID=A0A090DBZ7_MESPL|nr:hypothetical protein MPL3356_140004 [Mesorhizobium plurifarium]